MKLHRVTGPLQVLFTLLTLSTYAPASIIVRDPIFGPNSRARPLPAPTLRARAMSFMGDAPEAAVWEFQRAFVARDLAAYDALLAEDFVFRFRPEDVAPGEPDTLDKRGEMNFAGHLFRGSACSGAPPADQIELTVEILDRRGDPKQNSWVAFLIMTHATLHLRGGGTINIVGPVSFLVHRDAASGRWQLVEWVEVPNTVSVLAQSLTPSGRHPWESDVPALDSLALAREIRVFSVGAPWPNPAGGVARIAYAVPKRSHLSANLYSVDGRRALLLKDSMVPPGEGTILIDTKRLGAGVYYLRVDDGEHAYARKMVVIH